MVFVLQGEQMVEAVVTPIATPTSTATVTLTAILTETLPSATSTYTPTSTPTLTPTPILTATPTPTSTPTLIAVTRYDWDYTGGKVIELPYYGSIEKIVIPTGENYDTFYFTDVIGEVGFIQDVTKSMCRLYRGFMLSDYSGLALPVRSAMLELGLNWVSPTFGINAQVSSGYLVTFQEKQTCHVSLAWKVEGEKKTLIGLLFEVRDPSITPEESPTVEEILTGTVNAFAFLPLYPEFQLSSPP